VSEHREPLSTGRRTYRIAGLRDRSTAPPTTLNGHIDDLVAAYALGALEPDEAAAVDTHVRGCSSCEHELLDAQRTAGMLSFAVPLRTPSPDTKAALFARVAHARKAAAAASLPTQGIDAFRTPTIPGSAGVEELVLPSRADTASAVQPERPSRSGWLVSAISLPLLMALIATGFWGIQLRNQLAAQNSQLAELQSELTNFGSGTTTYQLSPGGAAPQAEGKIVMGADQRAGMVQIDVNSGDGPIQYEMLVNKDGMLVPVSEFTVDPDGKGQARFELDQPFSEYESVHIQAKPVASVDNASHTDTLFQNQDSALGSTGSGLDIGP
jgi:anti-sigma factor RsiW